MSIDLKGHNAITVRRMSLADVEGVISLVAHRIEKDQEEGRSRRLGPVTRETLLRSFDEFAGLSVVLLQNQKVVGCALVAVFEPLEDSTMAADPAVAEAAKLTLDESLLGTKAASILHALRIAGVTLIPRLGGEAITLYYNVLSGNVRQLEHIRGFALQEVEPRGYAGAVLEQRASRIDLEGQRILSFTLSAESEKRAVDLLLQATADRLLSRSDRNQPMATLEAWELRFEHPLLTDELGILIKLADELGVAVPRQLRSRAESGLSLPVFPPVR
jgi:hypothetical protein